MRATQPELLSKEFRKLSARLGQDPLQVQGPGGNTSVKSESVMWIKASGTELANAETQDIFVPVDRSAAKAEANGSGDGSCKDTVLDPANKLRPSIETTFHAALDYPIIVHTHSVATISHVISPQGREALATKLKGLPFVLVPYAKPGLALTQQIMARVEPDTKVILLQNHGLICCGDSVEEVTDLIAEVEQRLQLPVNEKTNSLPKQSAPEGFDWAEQSWIAHDDLAKDRAVSGTYYPDHVVFLGPALPLRDHIAKPPAIVFDAVGIAMRQDATSSQRAMLTCLGEVLSRVPEDWDLDAIGQEAEAELLDWDAEKYRQALAAKK